MKVGASPTLGADPTFTTVGTHDTSLATRQLAKLETPVEDRFLTIRFEASSSKAVRFLGGLAYAWAERVP